SAMQGLAKRDEMEIDCNNDFLANEDPDFGSDEDKHLAGHPTRYATCGIDDPGEYGPIYDIVFVPDAKRGVRIAAVSETESGATNDWLWPELAGKLTGVCK